MLHTGETLEAELNELGQQGFAIVTVTHHSVSQPTVIIILQRTQLEYRV